MGRPPVIPPEKKAPILLAVLAGEVSIAEAARKEKESIGRWKAEFLEAGKAALVAGRTGPSTREAQLEVEVADLTQALGDAAVEIATGKPGRAMTSAGVGHPRGCPAGGLGDRDALSRITSRCSTRTSAWLA